MADRMKLHRSSFDRRCPTSKSVPRARNQRKIGCKASTKPSRFLPAASMMVSPVAPAISADCRSSSTMSLLMSPLHSALNWWLIDSDLFMAAIEWANICPCNLLSVSHFWRINELLHLHSELFSTYFRRSIPSQSVAGLLQVSFATNCSCLALNKTTLVFINKLPETVKMVPTSVHLVLS